MLARMQRRIAGWVVVGFGLAALAGCGGSEPTGPDLSAGRQTASTSWSEPDHYAYTLLSTCGERGGLGAFRVWVRAGQVERAKPLSQGADLLPLRQMPTVGDIVRIAAAAQSGGADEVRVTRTPDGQPRWVSIDYMTNAIDDEACYRVTSLTPLS
jgi:hypothetical protein